MSRPKKVVLWTTARSVSTAFFRAMMNRDRVKVLFEPYVRAYHLGAERMTTVYQSKPVLDGFTFEEVKRLYENLGDEEDDLVFAKDIARSLMTRLDSTYYLPEGYIHTFLVRDPHKTISSFYKQGLEDGEDYHGYDYASYGYRELYRIFELVTETLQQEPIVVDADDLLTDPEWTLKEYCRRLGLAWDARMLDWGEVPQELNLQQDWLAWYKEALATKTFSTPRPAVYQYHELPVNIQRAIDGSMEHYLALRQHRIKKP